MDRQTLFNTCIAVQCSCNHIMLLEQAPEAAARVASRGLIKPNVNFSQTSTAIHVHGPLRLLPYQLGVRRSNKAGHEAGTHAGTHVASTSHVFMLCKLS
jgi:hypothetical protein